MCLPDEETCLLWLKQIAATAPGTVTFDFVVEPKLWGSVGVPARITARRWIGYGLLLAVLAMAKGPQPVGYFSQSHC